MMHGKAIWKRGIGVKGKASRDIAVLGGQYAETRWAMVYGHKTQSAKKIGGQQKCPWMKPCILVILVLLS